MPLMVNQLQALSVRLVTPWNGVWFADVDLSLDPTDIPPVGPVALTLGTSVYLGTVDPRASGTFANNTKLRILGGGGGWDKPVLPIHFHNPALLSTIVYGATATEVGEVVVDALPKPLGEDYARCAGPASRIFGDSDWHVTPQGITTVGPRLPLPYDPTSTEILSWDPLTRTAELASDSPIAPGTILIDPALRFTEPLIVRDVEQTWSAEGGARATVWCGEKKGTRLQNALAALVTEKARLPFLKTYRYRVVLQDPATEALALQIINPLDGAPNALPFSMWMGVPGVGAKVLLGSEVLVGFVNGDPTFPVVTGFKAGQVPILLELGTGLGGPIALATGTQTQIAALEVQVAALTAWVAAVTALAATPPTSTTFTLFGLAMAAPGATVAAAVAAQIPVIAAAVTPATSHLVVSD